MQRRHDGRIDCVQQHHEMLAGRTSEDAELVLHADNVGGSGVDATRGLSIIGGLVLADGVAHFRWVVVTRPLIRHGDHVAAQGRIGGDQGFANIGGEGGDAAASGRIIADQNNFLHARDGHRRETGV